MIERVRPSSPAAESLPLCKERGKIIACVSPQQHKQHVSPSIAYYGYQKALISGNSTKQVENKLPNVLVVPLEHYHNEKSEYITLPIMRLFGILVVCFVLLQKVPL